MKIIYYLKMGITIVNNHILMRLNRFNAKIIPKPFRIFYLITTRCNADCKFCQFARSIPQPPYKEASTEEIIAMLTSFKKYMGSFHISISGGEPLLRKSCLLEIAKFAKENNIMLGITTNGFLLDREFCENAMKDNLFFNINVSIDFIDDNHCRERGVSVTFGQLREKLSMLSQSKRKYLAKTKLIVKTIIRPDNLNQLAKLVNFTRDIGFNQINFQPIVESTEYAKSLKNSNCQEELKKALEELKKYRKDYSLSILNEKEHFETFFRYFAGTLKRDSGIICHVGFENLFIYPNLDVSFGCFENFGNLREDDVSTLWKSEKANEIREKIKKCKKQCLTTCQIERTLIEKIKYGYRILFGI